MIKMKNMINSIKSLRGLSKSHNHLRNINRFYTTGDNRNNKNLLDGCGIIGSYANALFTASKTAGNLKNVMDDLLFLSEALQTCEDFSTFITTPGLTSVDKIKFLREGLESVTSPLQLQTLNCLEMLFEQKRSNEILKLKKYFETLYLNENGQLKCLVQSAVQLSDSQKNLIANGIRHRLNNKMEPIIEYKINPNILGGLVVNVGDDIIDASISNQLERMQAQLSHQS